MKAFFDFRVHTGPFKEHYRKNTGWWNRFMTGGAFTKAERDKVLLEKSDKLNLKNPKITRNNRPVTLNGETYPPGRVVTLTADDSNAIIGDVFILPDDLF